MQNRLTPYFIITLLLFSLHGWGETLPKDGIVTGLHPIEKVVKEGSVTYWYQAKLTINGFVEVYDKALQFKHWESEWFFSHDPSFLGEPIAKENIAASKPFYIHASMQYNGPLQLTETQLDQCRPEVLLLPVSGVQVEYKPYEPSWSEWLWSAFVTPDYPQRMMKTESQPVNLVMFMVDTLRADHTTMYGHPFVNTPHIEMLANLGTLFTESYGASSSTRPSVGSMFTGLQPNAHGAVRHSLTGADLHSSVSMLPESADSSGMETIGISSNSQVTAAFGFSRGYDIYHCPVRDNQVTPKALDYLNKINEPFFMYLHYMAPHAPYEPSSVYKSMYAGQTAYDEQDRYCAEISMDDQRIGLVLKELADQGLINRTMIWLVSDHGEEFWEHNWNGHGANLYEESVRTVSVFTAPHWYPMQQRIDMPVMHADMFPTLCHVFGWETPEIQQGVNLIPIITGQEVLANDRNVYLHHGGGLDPQPHPSDKQAIVQGKYKLVWWTEKNEWELYNLENDVVEQNNLANTETGTVTRLKPLLEKHVKASNVIGDSLRSRNAYESLLELTDDDLENLRSSGYIQ